MKRVLKVTLILVIMLAIQFSVNFVYAEEDSPGGTSKGKSSSTTSSETTSSGELINPDSYKPRSPGGTEELESKAGYIVAVIRNVGIVVSVIALMVIGIRTMLASAEEKAVYKQSLPGYLLGVFMVIAMTAIPSIIYNFAKGW